jgi:N-acetylmuramoyl-L-alanine amidase
VRSALSGFAVVAICAGAIIAVEAQHDAAETAATHGATTTIPVGTRRTTTVPPTSSTTASVHVASTSTPSAPSTSTVAGGGHSGTGSGAGNLADLHGVTVAIDPGHNGGNGAHPDEINRLVQAGGFTKACDTTGTQANDGYPEHAFTFDVSMRLAAILRSAGANVVMTRTDDASVGPCVNERAAVGNDAHAAVAVSIHADGGPPDGRGFHVLTPAGCSGCENSIVAPSATLAGDVRDALRDDTPMPISNYLGSNGIYPRTDLGGLNLSTVPKVMIECGNMRNATDAGLLEDPGFRQRAAQAIANSLATYLASK